MKNILVKFSQETTSHGLKNIGDSSSSVLNRLMWCLVVAGMATGLVYTLLGTYQGYTEHRVLTVSTTEQQKQQPFPSITICNRGQVSNRSGQITNELLLYLRSSASPSSSYNWSRPYAQSIANISSTSLEELLAFDWEDIIEEPAFNDVFLKIYDENMFDIRDTLLGRCILINGPLSKKKYGGINATHFGSDHSLSLFLDAYQNEYVPTLRMDAGFELFVHEPFEFIDVTNGGILLSPGTFNKISLTRLNYKLLPYPFKSFGDEYCEEDHSDRIRTINQQNGYEEYSRTACFFDCAARRSVETCGCNAIFQNGKTYGNTRRSCTLYEISTCYIPLFASLKSKSDACNCPRLCHYVSFEATISHSSFPSRAGFEYIRQTEDPEATEKYARENWLYVKIFYKDMFSRETKHVPEFDFDRVFGSVGGQMGLFLGASLVSAFELVLIICTVLGTIFKRVCYLGHKKETAEKSMNVNETKTNVNFVLRTIDKQEAKLGTKSQKKNLLYVSEKEAEFNVNPGNALTLESLDF